MNKILKQLTNNMMLLNPPTTREIINEVEVKLEMKLPEQYVEFMLEYNGAEGQIGSSSYLAIWSIEQLVPLNEEYTVNEFTPGLVYFGSDGGGMAYAFDVRGSTISIVEFPFESIEIDDAKFCGNTFVEFLEYLYQHD